MKRSPRQLRLLASAAFTALLASRSLAQTQPADLRHYAPTGASPLIAIDQADVGGVDALGRALPTYAKVGDPKPNRYVGLFYWQWHGHLSPNPSGYDMSEYLATRPRFDQFNAYPADASKNPTFYWSKPLFGYYKSTDPWVIRKHLALISDAGVDFLFLDYTNSSVYDEELKTFLNVRSDLQSKGATMPRLSFFLNHQPEWKIESLYVNWFKPDADARKAQGASSPGLYDDAWFRWAGKPLLMAAMPTDASKLKNPALLPEIQQFFTWRPTWALQKATNTPGMWRFIAELNDPPTTRPADDTQAGAVEQMVVNKSMGGPIWAALERGGVSATADSHFTAKSYDDQWRLPDRAQGKFFQAGWDKAMQVAPPMLLVTGWNEWTASIWEHPGVVMLGKPTVKGQGYVVDEFNEQFNRDLEPMAGGYGDDYYCQLLENIRRYKGMKPPQAVSGEKTFNLSDPSSLTDAAWADVTPVFHDTVGDTANRDWPAKVPDVHYTDHSARNDLATAQVARDANFFYFRVTTAAPLSPASDPDWMQLLIDTDGDADTGWHGYDLLINRTHMLNMASIEKFDGAAGEWKWTYAATASTTATWVDNKLVIAVPRKLLKNSASLRFKWIDNVGAKPTIDDLYTQGDAAPNGRFNFVYPLTAK